MLTRTGWADVRSWRNCRRRCCPPPCRCCRGSGSRPGTWWPGMSRRPAATGSTRSRWPTAASRSSSATWSDTGSPPRRPWASCAPCWPNSWPRRPTSAACWSEPTPSPPACRPCGPPRSPWRCSTRPSGSCATPPAGTPRRWSSASTGRPGTWRAPGQDRWAPARDPSSRPVRSPRVSWSCYTATASSNGRARPSSRGWPNSPRPPPTRPPTGPWRSAPTPPRQNGCAS